MKILLIAFSAFIMLTLVSCDQCKNVECLNAGTCAEGVCDCLDGFTGENCQVEDKCITGNVTCEHGKTCIDGTCDCGQWYDGSSCETKVVDTYVGPYQGYFGCSNQNGFVSFGTVADVENELNITEYTGREYSCVFLTQSSFEIPSQTLPEEFGYGALEVSGSGSIDATGQLQYSITYNYPSQGSSTTCIFSGN
jgi:hypothetical protein